MHESNCDGVYGAKKIWKQLRREGVEVANCTVPRLMKEEGLSGARRARQFKLTTISDENQHRPSDLVDRQFIAPAPNRLWVANLTYVKTHRRWVYVAFIIDVFSRAIVGGQASTSLRSDVAIDALEMAIYARKEHDLTNLVHHSDRGVQRRVVNTTFCISHHLIQGVRPGESCTRQSSQGALGKSCAGPVNRSGSCGN